MFIIDIPITGIYYYISKVSTYNVIILKLGVIYMSMVAEHAKWPKENDIIFSLSERAQAAESATMGKIRLLMQLLGL